MMDSKFIVAAIVVVGAILLRLLGKAKGEEMKWPPGPAKLPIIGNLHQIAKGGNLLYLTFAKLAQEHGNLMTVWLGGWKPTIVVSGQEQVWEVLVTKSSEFGSHTAAPTGKYLSAGWKTVATAEYGPYWHTLRKGIQNSVMNPSTISAQVHTQESDVAALVDALALEASPNDGVVRPFMNLKKSTMRLMSRLLFGSDFETDEQFMEGLDRIVDEIDRINRNSGLTNIVPFSRYIPGIRRPFSELVQVERKIVALFRPVLSLSEQNTYLHFLRTQDLSDDVIVANLNELFLLSVDSVSTTTTWALAFLIHDQGIQEKLYDEIKRNGFSKDKKGRVSVQDLSNMHYIHAVVKETMRLKPIAPLAFPHRAAKDTTLMGTKITKGTAVVVNLHQVLNDPNVWEKPESFRPERFLAGNGDGGDEHMRAAMEWSFIPFGAGRRVCAGMELAKLQIALVLANLVAAYRWSGVNGKPPDLTEAFNGLLMLKTPLEAKIEHRMA